MYFRKCAMPRSYKLYLTDIRRSINRIQLLVQNLDKTEFDSQNIQTDGVLFNLMTIGEAAKNIPEDIRVLMPEIEWGKIGRFRDFVVHHYFELNMGDVWTIVQNDLPQLNSQVEQLLQLLNEPDTHET